MSTWNEISIGEAERLMDCAAEEGVRVVFLVPQERQGQGVEHAYAGIGEYGVMRRVTDRSDGSISYSMRDWEDEDEEHPGLNGEPA